MILNLKTLPLNFGSRLRHIEHNKYCKSNKLIEQEHQKELKVFEDTLAHKSYLDLASTFINLSDEQAACCAKLQDLKARQHELLRNVASPRELTAIEAEILTIVKEYDNFSEKIVRTKDTLLSKLPLTHYAKLGVHGMLAHNKRMKAERQQGLYDASLRHQLSIKQEIVQVSNLIVAKSQELLKTFESQPEKLIGYQKNIRGLVELYNACSETLTILMSYFLRFAQRATTLCRLPMIYIARISIRLVKT